MTTTTNLTPAMTTTTSSSTAFSLIPRRMTTQDTCVLASWGRSVLELYSEHNVDPLDGERYYLGGERINVYRPQELHDMAESLGKFIIDQDFEQLSMFLGNFMNYWDRLLSYIEGECSDYWNRWYSEDPCFDESYDFLAARHYSREALQWEVHFMHMYCNEITVNIPKFMYHLERALLRYERLFKGHYFVRDPWDWDD